MKSLLEADLKTGKVDVVRTGTCAGYTWRVTWLERPGGQPLMTVRVSSKINCIWFQPCPITFHQAMLASA